MEMGLSLDFECLDVPWRKILAVEAQMWWLLLQRILEHFKLRWEAEA